MESVDFEGVSRELLRALRGTRSQAMFSRRLGFRSNVAAKWESGQRMPTASDVVEYSRRSGTDPRDALARFLPAAADALGSKPSLDITAWMRALRGSQQLGTLAKSSQLSRYSVGRFLSGASEPRLPQFLALVDAMTGRVEDLVDAWVGVENVPLLSQRAARSRAAREALFQRPLCLAVMCLLDTTPLAVPESEQIEALSRTLECDQHTTLECLETLRLGGVIALEAGRYVLTGGLTVDARATPEQEAHARSFWTHLAHERTRRARTADLCSYNVFSASRDDFAKLRELQREFYRGARSLIAASEPTEIAGLLVVQLVSWQPGEEELPTSGPSSRS